MGVDHDERFALFESLLVIIVFEKIFALNHNTFGNLFQLPPIYTFSTTFFILNFWFPCWGIYLWLLGAFSFSSWICSERQVLFSYDVKELVNSLNNIVLKLLQQVIDFLFISSNIRFLWKLPGLLSNWWQYFVLITCYFANMKLEKTQNIIHLQHCRITVFHFPKELVVRK